MPKNNKVAIVYDWLDKWGGVERILLELKKLFPEADFYTSYQDLEKAVWAKKLQAKTSFIQKMPGFIKSNRVLSLPFYSLVFENFDFSNYSLVISVSSSFAKSVITKSGTRHICYLLTPTRYFWFQKKFYFKNKLFNILATPYLNSLKKWDLAVSKRPDILVSISQTVASRAKKYYGRDSLVIYPPFNIDYWQKIKSEIVSSPTESNNKFFLIVSRLEPYKQVELAVKVFNKRPNHKLIIVGEGSEKTKLKNMAKKNIAFVSHLTDKELAKLYVSAEGLIMPQEEDFGYVSLEAQFFGCPVISYKKGGAKETVVDKTTGIFFETAMGIVPPSALSMFTGASIPRF